MKKELLMGIGIGALVMALVTGVNLASWGVGLMILACPLMMISMMAGHGHGHSSTSHDDRNHDDLLKSK